MLQCCLLTPHKEQMTCQNRTKHTDWNDRADECPKHFIFIAQNNYIQWFALLFYGNVASSCGKSQVLSVSYFLDWKIYCTLLFCVLHAFNTRGKERLNCFFEEKLAELIWYTTLYYIGSWSYTLTHPTIRKCIIGSIPCSWTKSVSSPGIIFPGAIVIVGWKMFLQKCACILV